MYDTMPDRVRAQGTAIQTEFLLSLSRFASPCCRSFTAAAFDDVPAIHLWQFNFPLRDMIAAANQKRGPNG